MKAAVFYGKHDIRIEEISTPEIGERDVLIRVRACGVCGTDVHIFNGDEGAAKSPPHTVLGHEFSGEVIRAGAKVSGVSAGDRVCVDPNKLCGQCDYCRSGIGHFCEHMVGIGTTVDGGFAEYCAVPESQVYKFGPELTCEKAAMTEPVSCCIHGIDLCEIECGGTVAVIGCGMIGLIMIQLARLRGAAKIIAVEPVESKRKQALSLGADVAVNPTGCDVPKALAAAGVQRVGTVIECVGKTGTIGTAVEIAGRHSIVMMFGLTAPADTVQIRPFELFKKEITLKASYINPYTFSRALALIESGKIDVSSMVHAVAPVEKLPAILSDPGLRAKGKYLITCG